MASVRGGLSDVDYARAERFLPWNKGRYVLNADIQHHWIGDTDRFWYLRTNDIGQKQFVVVDAETGNRSPAFDHQGLASALSAKLGKEIGAGDLPFSTIRYAPDQQAIEFLIADTLWTYSVSGNNQLSAKPFNQSLADSVSPNGHWAAFLRDDNIWVRSTSGHEEFALTTDGVDDYGYAGSPGISSHAAADIRGGMLRPPQMLWSPDSRYLLSHRIDEREVGAYHLIQSVPDDGSVRPKLYSYRYALPGDEHIPMLEPVIFDLTARRQIHVSIPALPCSWWTPIEKRTIWWSPDSHAFYYIVRNRYFTSASLYKVDLITQTLCKILHEESDNIEEEIDDWHIGDLVRTLSNGDVLWYSLRDGWGHLYHYSATGELIRQLTQGEWMLRAIVRVDEVSGRLYFAASGREPGCDPYEQRLYRIELDGSGLTLLTPEEAEHPLVPDGGTFAADPLSAPAELECFSASGRYFVDSYSRPHVPPVLALRDCEGRLIRELERADISRLRIGGYTPVEPFEVMAADGMTPIYGNLYRPSHIDPTKTYPVIDACDPSIQSLRAGKSFISALFDDTYAQCVAELGFIVVILEGRGTPRRSQSFRSYARGRLDRVSEPKDHIAGIRQLARRYPYMDISRVGIYGSTGGGNQAAYALCKFPDFYKVAVANAGCHDYRAQMHCWGEAYIGPLETGDYAAASTIPLAGNLEGRLLLSHAALDENVSPAQTMKLVDALVKANKDFDLLILPNDTLSSAWISPYFIRRKWDYFVRHLLGLEPPADYAINGFSAGN